MECSDLVSLVSGYRHQEVDYQYNNFLLDVELTGPMYGLTFRFRFAMNGLIQCNH
jgi:hypothetical protein